MYMYTQTSKYVYIYMYIAIYTYMRSKSLYTTYINITYSTDIFQSASAQGRAGSAQHRAGQRPGH